MVSAMPVQADSAQEIIARAKAAGKRVVAGGPAFNIQRERFAGVDHFILGEAEAILPEFVRDLSTGAAREVYQTTERPDLAAPPIPLWSLLNFKDYLSLSVQYSRGCPCDCGFCGIVAMNGRQPRVNPERMLAELQSLYDAGWRDNLFIVDDSFIGNMAHVKEFLPRFAAWQNERGSPYKPMTEASINLALDPKLMQMMSAANRRAVRSIHQHGMQVLGGVVVGFGRDTPSIFEPQYRFIQIIGVVTAMAGVLNALPQTGLWRRLKAEGRLRGTRRGENTDASLNFAPSMGREALLAGYRRLLCSSYSHKEYDKRINAFLAAYIPTANGRIIPTDLLALAKSTWSIGVISHVRLSYWKRMIRTLLTKRKTFSVAVELAMLGLHTSGVWPNAQWGQSRHSLRSMCEAGGYCSGRHPAPCPGMSAPPRRPGACRPNPRNILED
jgi:radical SAM superfamily enzyme YgiQ (UPF0313 family)